MGVSVKRIVVTGMGIVSPLGCGVQHVWQSLLAGKSGITRLSEQLVADILTNAFKVMWEKFGIKRN